MKQPNIVFFFTDDQRFDTINALGNKDIVTPNMDRLVREGVSFTQAHIPGGTVGAVCMPSRAMLHTSKTLFHLQDDGSRVPAEHKLIGEYLQEAGYNCFGTGKWHNGHESYARSFNCGGEIYFGGMWDHWNIPAYDYDPSGQYEKVGQWTENPFYNRETTEVRANHLTLGKHSSELFADVTVDFIQQYSDAKPFFAYVAFMAPHDPRTMPDKYLSLYDPASLTLEDNQYPQHPFDYGVSNIRDEVLAPYPRTEEDNRVQLAEYYGMISHLDHEIGRILQALEEKGEYENTIFVFAGDNGLAVGRHGLYGKQSNYEHSVRVPLIFSGPGIPRGQTSDSYCYLLDIYPTLMDLLGMEKPGSLEGRSLYPDIRGEPRESRDGLYLVYGDLVRGVKCDGYKLIEYNTPDKKGRTQLFNLLDDPQEIHDLSGQAQYQQKVAGLRQKMLLLRDEWGDLDHAAGHSFWQAFANRNVHERSLCEVEGPGR
uniref:sulfatase-like hydrolase/transferase n=1 Tax=Marinobacterium profundum TaxID=1714300 RepID=UPI0009EBE8B2|nr:sulfatase-like hydrolase/transferase [Marinobacterium profundum]